MKLILIGDKHLKVNQLELSRSFLTWAVSKINELQPDMVVSLGDDFHDHAVIRAEIMGEFIKFVESLLHVPHVYVLGNHDQYRPNDATYHALQPLKDKYKTFKVVDSRYDLGNITFVPYTHDISKFPLDTKEICICHQTFIGADYGSYKPEIGVDSEAVSAEIIISGHIHKRQNFGKVNYVGSPFSQDANDIDQIKGIFMFDTDTYQFTFIEAPFPKWRRLEFTLDQSFTVENLRAQLPQMVNAEDKWFVEITGPKAEVNAYVNSKDLTALKKVASIRLKTKYNDKEKKIASIKSMSVDSILEEYFSKIYDGSLDKKRLLTIAQETANKVNK